MLYLGILLCLLALSSSISQDQKDVCNLIYICDNVSELKSEMAAMREEQQHQTEILEGLTVSGTLSYPLSCAEVSKTTKLHIRVPEYSEDPFEVACDQRSHGGGWTIILRRNDGSQDFYLEWEDYKHGFGQLGNEFFLGLDKIHGITAAEPQELLVLLQDYEGTKRYEMYDDFKVGPESNNYTLESLGIASGDAGDSLTEQLGMMFSTKDRKNDLRTNGEECAIIYTGAWWYANCHASNLCGKYGDNSHGKGVTWYSFRGNGYSLKSAMMMIRPKTSALN
ncbi:ryncolin-1-like [Drosophila kikkawai]|uniref:Ryncolin-1-like n=1 Tax=Drosophila kikkawai TaxID=30033 RepID=A0A6P4JAA9_DROKI|nr:ryncolin-1-like [Drosophila kikkawai]